MTRTIDRRPGQPARGRHARWLLALVGLLWCAACAGGSGSSGFDISENAAIEQALESQQCVPVDGLEICPTDDGRASGAETAIDTNIGSSNTVPCVAAAPGEPCLFFFAFAPAGFPPGAMYRVAFRTVPPDGPWSLSPVPAGTGSPDAPSYQSPIQVDRETDAGQPPDLQIAVLVFLEPPPPLPATVDRLADTGADFAFVTPALMAQ